MPQAPKTLNSFESLIQIVRDLRGPEGCPWDKEQTHKTLTPYAVEETHEMVEAIESEDDSHICEELGDVLFQVILHAQLAHERGSFDIHNVIEGINQKVVRRHPHVFSDVKVEGTDEVLKNWDEIKKQEKKNKKTDDKKSVIDIPPSMPSLQRAARIGEKTEKYKFDWKHSSEVLAQLKAEIAELEEVMSSYPSDEAATALQHELGDVLFSAAQLARHLKQEPEAALREANRRFLKRFDKMLTYTSSLEQFVELSQNAKEELWTKAKKDV